MCLCLVPWCKYQDYLGGNFISVGWQVTLCDPIWHVSLVRHIENCYSVYFTFLPFTCCTELAVRVTCVVSVCVCVCVWRHSRLPVLWVLPHTDGATCHQPGRSAAVLAVWERVEHAAADEADHLQVLQGITATWLHRLCTVCYFTGMIHNCLMLHLSAAVWYGFQMLTLWTL